MTPAAEKMASKRLKELEEEAAAAEAAAAAAAGGAAAGEIAAPAPTPVAISILPEGELMLAGGDMTSDVIDMLAKMAMRDRAKQ